MNDKRYSGFNSKDPLIVFDMDSVVQNYMRELSSIEIRKAAQKDATREALPLIASILGVYGAIGVTKFKEQKNRKKSST